MSQTRATHAQIMRSTADPEYAVVELDGIIGYTGQVDVVLAGLACLFDERDMPIPNPLVGGHRVRVQTGSRTPITDRLLFVDVYGPEDEWFAAIDQIFARPYGYCWAEDRPSLLTYMQQQLPYFEQYVADHGLSDDVSYELLNLDLSNCPDVAELCRANYLTLLGITDVNQEPWWRSVPYERPLWYKLKFCLDSHEDGQGCAMLTYLWSLGFLRLAIPVLQEHLGT